MAERHVVHVIRSDGFAGVERYVSDTVAELARRGWGVTVIGGHPDLMRAALPDTVRYIPGRSTAEVARAIWRCRRSPVLHTHMTAAEAAAAPLKGLCFDRWVTTRHFARPRGDSRLGRAASPLIRARVDVQIAISNYVAESIDGPSVVVHNGVPPSTQAHVERDRTVVMMQRLEPEKATATGVRAWALSDLASDGWRLRVFGRGSELGRLRALSDDLGVSDSVTFEGFSSDPRRVLAEAGIVLAPCAIDGFGLSVVEAMSERAPIVAADGGAHRETLGEAGMLFDAGDPQHAATALRRLALDENARSQLARDLYARFAAEFTAARHVDALEQVYLG